MLTAQQLDERLSGIGSSDAPAVLGVNPYRSAVDVYLEKTGEREPADLTDNQAVHFGNVLEDVIATEYVRRTGCKVRRRNQTFRHADYPHMVCHPDRTIDHARTILECKTAGQYMADAWGEAGSDEVPDEYLVQVTHQMIVMGYEHADLAVLIGGRDFRIYQLALDAELADILITREGQFWNDHVLAGLPPEPADAHDLISLYPADSGNAELASAETVETVAELKRVRAGIKAMEDHKTTLEQTIKTEMKDAAALVDDTGKTLVTWKQAKASQRFDAKAFVASQPELYQQFTKEQPGSRRFLVK
jgi:putative phage-type endonuclease